MHVVMKEFRDIRYEEIVRLRKDRPTIIDDVTEYLNIVDGYL